MNELTIIPEDAPATELTKFSLEIGSEPDGYRAEVLARDAQESISRFMQAVRQDGYRLPASLLFVRVGDDDDGEELLVDLRTWQDPFTEASP